ncbi:hypothetical protein V6N13_149512 [Hibiscus sabdariffa]|uniref:Uncharacterized protein n=1 Tax=Hibiscus sabdariffa TaxID=183260 RepID=A0ABR2EH56_9ROSI
MIFQFDLEHLKPKGLAAMVPVIIGITVSLIYLNYRGLPHCGVLSCLLATLDFELLGQGEYVPSEVENRSKTFPKLLLGAVDLVVLSYLIPFLTTTGHQKTMLYLGNVLFKYYKTHRSNQNNNLDIL